MARMLASLQPGEIVLIRVDGAEYGTTLDVDALARVIAAVRARATPW